MISRNTDSNFDASLQLDWNVIVETSLIGVSNNLSTRQPIVFTGQWLDCRPIPDYNFYFTVDFLIGSSRKMKTLVFFKTRIFYFFKTRINFLLFLFSFFIFQTNFLVEWMTENQGKFRYLIDFTKIRHQKWQRNQMRVGGNFSSAPQPWNHFQNTTKFISHESQRTLMLRRAWFTDDFILLDCIQNTFDVLNRSV